jgi:paraquat-inducible protein A
MAKNVQLACPLCGKAHRPVPLAPGENARCTRCDTVMAKGRRGGEDVPYVFCVTGLVLALPACLLPLVSAGKLGAERTSTLFTGVGALWDNGMRALAVLVLLCGALLPISLLGILALLRAPERFSGFVANQATLVRVAKALELCAIPEVQVLAVLVALMKLGSVVNVSIGPGFWFYCAMAFSLILAQRRFDFRSIGNGAAAEGASP